MKIWGAALLADGAVERGAFGAAVLWDGEEATVYDVTNGAPVNFSGAPLGSPTRTCDRSSSSALWRRELVPLIEISLTVPARKRRERLGQPKTPTHILSSGHVSPGVSARHAPKARVAL